MILLAMEKYVRQNVQVYTEVIPIIETKKTQVGFQILYANRMISLRNTTLTDYFPGKRAR